MQANGPENPPEQPTTHHIVDSGQGYMVPVLAHIGHILLQLLELRLDGRPLAFHGQTEDLVRRIPDGGAGTRGLRGGKEVHVLLVAVARAVVLGIGVGLAGGRGPFAGRGRVIRRTGQRGGGFAAHAGAPSTAATPTATPSARLRHPDPGISLGR